MDFQQKNIKFLKGILILLISIIPAFGLPDNNIANKYFLEKQKFLFEILHKIEEPLQNVEWLTRSRGKTLVWYKTCYMEFNGLMEEYAFKVNSSTLLAKNENFHLSDSKQLQELKGLYYFLYNAQDFETLRQNICWARMNVQPQMFVFALTQTLMKREDFKDLNLPKIYEIWPQHFFADKHIRKLKHFNYVNWSKSKLLSSKSAESNNSLHSTCLTQQWWCKQNLTYQIYEEKERLLWPQYTYGNLRNSSKWLQALEDVTLYWLPVDFSREVASLRESFARDVSFLIEDKFWNSYWYYINMGLWLNERGVNDFYSKSLRDWWFWNLQQIVTRFKMETPHTFKQLDLNPYLVNFLGQHYQSLDKSFFQDMPFAFKDLFAKTVKALYEQTYELKNQTQLQLNNPNHLEYFLNENFAIDKLMKGFMTLPNKQRTPTVLQNFETMLRSQEFYQQAEFIIKLYKSLKSTFEPYKLQDFQSSGLVINNVEISELTTYFEIVDTDVSNLLRASNVYFEGKLMWLKALMVKQANLQHEPFTLQFNLSSDKPQAVLVRTFLTVDDSITADYFQLDSFVSNLAVGYNVIERESKDFYGFMSPPLSYTELYHLTELALKEQYEFPLNMTAGNCRFPHHLKLPKGLEDIGRRVKFIFVVTTYNFRFHKGSNLECDFSSGILAFDDLAPGFPFDRDVPENFYASDNVFIKQMKILHDEKLRFR